MMHGAEKSDPVIVAGKPANKAEQPPAERSAGEPNAAERVEPRVGTKGNAGLAKLVPDAEPGKPVTGAGTHTASRKGEKEGEVHRALPPHQYRAARRGVLRAQEGCRRGGGSAEVEGL